MADLFRKQAVNSFKEQFKTDRHISGLSFPTAILCAIFIFAVLLMIIWFVFGSITSAADVKGIVYPTEGVDKITAPKSGIISDITVKAGDSVKVGDVIGVISDEDILNEIEKAVSEGKDENTIELLRQNYYNSSLLKAKNDGVVLSVLNDNTYVEKGGSIAEIAAYKKDSNQRQILAFLPTSRKNNIKRGCSVQVSPNYAPRERFGYINGYVEDIGKTVITKSDAEREMNVYGIPNIIDDGETYIAVYINLLTDGETESGLNWSQKSSGSIDIETGTLCSCSIVVSQQPPYKWILGGGEK